MILTLLAGAVAGFVVCLALALGGMFDRWTKPEPPATRDPWRTDPIFKDCAELPIEALRLVARSERLAELRRDADRLEELHDLIELQGVERPCTLIIDDMGKVALKDGHSRLLVCPGLGYKTLPVKVKRAGRIRSHGRPAGDVLFSLLDR